MTTTNVRVLVLALACVTLSGLVFGQSPQIITTSLTGATASQSYSASLLATGGTTPYAWSIASGSLPNGLSLDPNAGAISGIPDTAGASSFTVQVTDANSLTATQSLSIAVAPMINGVSPLSGPVNTVVTISGAGFGTIQGTVTFNGTAATTFSSWNPTSIVVAVPAGASTGNVVVTVGGVARLHGLYLRNTDLELHSYGKPVCCAVVPDGDIAEQRHRAACRR